MNMTRHAVVRADQRAIPLDVVSIIYSYGTPSHSRGALRLRLDRGALELAHDDLPERVTRNLTRYCGTYLVTDGPAVITVARPTRRHRN